MPDAVIKIQKLTKDYGQERGIFDINLEVERGQVFGYVGTNGSGKTTTIRSLMGFIQADGGSSSILGLDSRKQSTEIMNHVSYVPGEIAFPALPTGTAFLKAQAEYLGVDNFSHMNHVIELLQLDTSASLKRMSKGMKQKTAIIAALMREKEILVLDEPTTGLDPLMRDAFLDLVREEKAKGHTVFMSSHIFEEIEDVCDKVAMIKDGRIIDVADVGNILKQNISKLTLTFNRDADLTSFAANNSFKITDIHEGCKCTVELPKSELNLLFSALKKYSLANISEQPASLEAYFMNVYEEVNR